MSKPKAKAIVSEAQREKLKKLVKSGEISQRDYEAMEKATGGKKLPKRVT